MEKGKKGAAKQAAIAPVAKTSNQPLTAAEQMKDTCNGHMHRYVLAQTHDGWCIDGIVEHVDDEYVCLAVPCNAYGWEARGFLPYPPFGPGLFPYPFYPRRRFYRQVFPLGGLLALSPLPYY
ncbi:hypothetical protein [Paenibacillus sp. NPDC058071]|uniref:hypothetical protein n=1 Tax=Paenibacillus sp. NPDC058071 TaxID=3346326 RepID=UPI0036DBF0D2